MSERFYVAAALAPGPVLLEGGEAHHLAAVCRARPGDSVCLFNGDGHEYPAQVTAVERRRVTLEILSRASPHRELGFHLEVAVPLPKGDRAQILIEKLTELGVTTLVPLVTRRSVVHPREGRLDKLQRHVIEASKQCGRNVLMHIAPLTDWSEHARSADRAELKVLAHRSAEQRGTGSEFRPGHNLSLAVGPEGGWTEEEVALAQTAGWHPLDLGPRTLRVETAALVLATWAILASGNRLPTSLREAAGLPAPEARA